MKLFLSQQLFHMFRMICAVMIMAVSGPAVNVVHAAPAEKVILAFGDSLTAGYGIPYEKSFPAQLEAKLKEEGYAVKVVNGGVSGDTTSGGLTRLEWMLEKKPDFVILELGANDMLRGVDPAVTRDNLQKMLEILKNRNIPVLLAGMKAAPNLGKTFTENYPRLYQELADKYDTLYYPFFMEGVVFHSDLLLDDWHHPNEKGVAEIVDRIFPDVEELLETK